MRRLVLRLVGMSIDADTENEGIEGGGEEGDETMEVVQGGSDTEGDGAGAGGNGEQVLSPHGLCRCVRGLLTSGTQDEEEESSREALVERINFDMSLPGSHSYLGVGDAVEGQAAIFPEGALLRCLPLLHFRDVVLFPGQTLPLTLSRSEWQLLCGGDSQELYRKVLGVVSVSLVRGTDMESNQALVGVCGTTAEVRSISMRDETVSILTLGRQRFRVTQSMIKSWWHWEGSVRVLREPPPLEIPHCIQHQNYHACHRSPGASAAALSKAPGGAFWPVSMYRMFDSRGLSAQARAWYLSVMGQKEGVELHEDPRSFSYWLAWTLMVDEASRQRLLEAQSCVERLRQEIAMLKRMGLMRCRACRFPICSHREAFSMSAEGPVSAFVNPGGVVHETATFYKAQNLVLVGERSTEHSWFPGYAWTICLCGRCGTHIGWQFNAVDKGAVPARFWGLSRSSLSATRIHAEGTSWSSEEEEEDDEEDDDEEEDSDADDGV